MRYFVVEYLRAHGGKYNEQASVHKKLKDKYLSTATVILDFKDRKIVKLRVSPTAGERDFDHIVDLYRNHGYAEVIEKIETGYKLINSIEQAVKKSETKKDDDNCVQG